MEIIHNDSVMIKRFRRALYEITVKTREDEIFQIANNALEGSESNENY